MINDAAAAITTVAAVPHATTNAFFVFTAMVEFSRIDVAGSAHQHNE
jgi:hypothetical protein